MKPLTKDTHVETSGNKSRVAGADSSRKLLQVLMLFTPAKPLWTIKEIGTELNLSQSAVYRYVALLREVGLLDGDRGKAYRVTDLVRSLAEAADATRESIGDLSMPWLTELRDQFNETAYLACRGGWYGYVVERVESQQPVRLVFERGQAIALHQGSGGRLLLSQMSHSDRANYFSLFGVDRTRHFPELLSDDALDALKAAGIAESQGETGEGLWSTAATISDGREVIATIGVAAPLFRLGEEQRDLIRQRITSAASEISDLLQQPARLKSA